MLVPDLTRVRALLRKHCEPNDADTHDALDRLDISYIKLAEEGAVQFLFEGARNDGQMLYLSALRVKPAKGERLATEQNQHWQRETDQAQADGFKRAAFYEPVLDLFFQVFPLDRRLPSLPVAADGRRVAPVLESVLAAQGEKIRHVVVRPMRYKPQRKCMFRYEITWYAPTAAPKIVYGKVARNRTFAQTCTILRQIRVAAQEITFTLPESLGVVPELCLELFSEVPGLPLADLSAADTFSAHCAATAQALRQFHALPVSMDQRWDVAAKLPRLAADAAGLTQLLPGQAKRIGMLQSELSVRLQATETKQLTLIHRDFHGTNVLVDGNRIGLIDLEDCAVGDPAEDLGSMCAYLSRLAAERPTQAAALRQGREMFVQAYGDNFGDRVRTHTALYCFFQALQQLRHPHVKERYSNAETLLMECQEILHT